MKASEAAEASVNCLISSPLATEVFLQPRKNADGMLPISMSAALTCDHLANNV